MADSQATNDRYEIGRAVDADVDGILRVQEPNLPEHGGTLSVRFSRDWFLRAIAAMPVIVARERGQVVGYLVSSPLEAYADVPIIQATLRAYPGRPGAYFYGPLCVDARHRGHHLSAAMFAALRKLLPGREGIFFLRRDNTVSVYVHREMGIPEVASFTYEGVDYAVCAYIG
ncbi:GNAT family N-acetyltransferase [Bauldia sp.]|uniref:GNAT family N-acetyltransferase n=1 Tax=Bauldia sp. TaxID=2575872 RepID=UPI003BA9673D